MVAIPNKENDRISAVDSSKRLPVAQAVKTLRRALPPCPVGKPPRDRIRLVVFCAPLQAAWGSGWRVVTLSQGSVAANLPGARRRSLF